MTRCELPQARLPGRAKRRLLTGLGGAYAQPAAQVNCLQPIVHLKSMRVAWGKLPFAAAREIAVAVLALFLWQLASIGWPNGLASPVGLIVIMRLSSIVWLPIILIACNQCWSRNCCIIRTLCTICPQRTGSEGAHVECIVLPGWGKGLQTQRDTRRTASGSTDRLLETRLTQYELPEDR